MLERHDAKEMPQAWRDERWGGTPRRCLLSGADARENKGGPRPKRLPPGNVGLKSVAYHEKGLGTQLHPSCSNLK